MQKSLLFLFLFAGLMTFTLTSCEEEETPIEKPNSEKSVAEIAADDEQFSTLVSALSRVDLVSVLSDQNQDFTVFAPTNGAFEALGVDLATLSDEALTEILLYHVFVGSGVESKDIADGQTYLGMGAATGPEGTNLSVLVDRTPTTGALTINGAANVIAFDVVGNNGVIHVIDQVLMPLNVVGHAAANSNFTSLVGALGAASGGLVDVLSSEGPFTVFAPLNSAFDAISDVTATLSEDQLASVLTYHVAAGNVTSNELSDAMEVTTVNGEAFTINLTDGASITDSRGNTVNIVLTDVQATNGVIHVLDAVILPAEL